MKFPIVRSALLAAAVLCVCAKPSFASTISYTGNLRTDANVTSCGSGCTLNSTNSDSDYAQWAAVVESFTISTASTVTAVTFGYGGGTNAAGTAIPEGGFEPYLSLFDAAGGFLSSTYYSGCPAGGNVNSASGACYDVALDGGILAAGTYEIAISAYENMSFAENYGSGSLSDGFTGLGNLAFGENLNYAFDLTLTPTTTTPPSPVPEPSSLLFVGSGCSLLLAYVRRQGFASAYRSKRQ